MTQDDMVKVARECGIGLAYGRESIERFYTFVAAAEREACAKVCERLPETFKIVADEFGYKAETPTAENYAAAIRTRSDE